MSILDQYKSSKIRHPSWRMYKAIADIRESKAASLDTVSEITLPAFGLSEKIDVYIPYPVNDELTDEIIIALTHEDYKDNEFKIASCLSIFCDVKARQLIEGMLMCGDIPQDIAQELKYDLSIVQTYAQVFFDISVWRSDADRLAYITRGTTGDDARIKRLIFERGFEYVRVKEFNMPSRIRLDSALQTIFGDAYQVILEKIKSGDNEDHKIAQGWAKYTLDIYRELKSSAKGTGGIRELTIALQTSKAPQRSIDDLE